MVCDNCKPEFDILLARIESLERRLQAYENAHTPSSKQRKNNTKRDEDKPRFPGKPPGSAGGGINLPPAEKTIEHTLQSCPDCHGHLELRGMRTQRVIDFPEKPLAVTEHQMLRYFCFSCDILLEANGPRDVYGSRLRSIIVMLKNQTLSCGKIAEFFRQLGAPSMSAAEVQRIHGEFAAKLEANQIKNKEEMRQAPYIHADETGMRKDGKNGYVWGVFTPVIAILSATMSRGREHIKALLGEYKGVIVTDGYNAYDYFPLRQRCWAHLLREFKKYAEKNSEIDVQYFRLKKLYKIMNGLLGKPPDTEAIGKVKAEFQDIVTCLSTIRPGRKLATHLQNGSDDWFTALYYPGVPLDNNHAERGLRHIVLHRKMMGCYRNEKGKKFIDIVISMLQTWKLQRKNIFQELCALGYT